MRLALLLSMLTLIGARTAPAPVPAPVVAAVEEPISILAPTARPELIRTSVTVSEARRAGVPIVIALAVTRHEVWNADSLAVGSAGEVGYFQIMPEYWSHEFPQCYPRRALTNPERNACIGVRILKLQHSIHHTWDAALRAYNGALHLKTAGDRYVAAVHRQMRAMSS